MEDEPTPQPRRGNSWRRIARAIPAALIAVALVAGIGWATWSVSTIENAGNSITGATLATPGSVDAVANGGSATCATGIDVSWAAVAGATSYRVERQSSNGAPDVRNASTGNVTSWTDTLGGDLHFTWTYRVTARVGTNWVSAGIGTDPTPLTCGIGEATNLVATKAVNCKSTVLTWTAAAGTVTGYDIQRNVNGGGWTAFGSTTTPTVTITDTGAHGAHASVLYRVYAKNGVTVSPNPSNEASITEWGCVIPPTNVAATSTCAANSRTVTWTGAPTPVDGYRLRRRIVPATGWTNITPDQGLVTTYTDTTTQAVGSQVEYSILSGNSSGGALWGTTASNVAQVYTGFAIVSIQLVNTGTLGTLDVGDQVVITFSKPVEAGDVTATSIHTNSNGNNNTRGFWFAATAAAAGNTEIIRLRTATGHIGTGVANGTTSFDGTRTVWTWTSTSSGISHAAPLASEVTTTTVGTAAARAQCSGSATNLTTFMPALSGQW